MFKKILISTSLMALCLSLVPVTPALAALSLNPDLRPESAPTLSGDTEENIQTVDEARIKLTIRFMNLILSVAGTVAVFFIVLNGWYIIGSAGSDEVLSQRKKALMWALIGLILLILSYTIIRFVIKLPFLVSG